MCEKIKYIEIFKKLHEHLVLSYSKLHKICDEYQKMEPKKITKNLSGNRHDIVLENFDNIDHYFISAINFLLCIKHKKIYRGLLVYPNIVKFKIRNNMYELKFVFANNYFNNVDTVLCSDIYNYISKKKQNKNFYIITQSDIDDYINIKFINDVDPIKYCSIINTFDLIKKHQQLSNFFDDEELKYYCITVEDYYVQTLSNDEKLSLRDLGFGFII